MSHGVKLTGRTRYRVQQRLFSKPLVVLQVEERHVGYVPDQYGIGSDFDYCTWRDAEVGDVTVKGGAE